MVTVQAVISLVAATLRNSIVVRLLWFSVLLSLGLTTTPGTVVCAGIDPLGRFPSHHVADALNVQQEYATYAPITSLVNKDACWPLVYQPSIPGRGITAGTLAAVTTLSSTDVWAVGYTGSALDKSAATQTLHWDGKAWSLVPSPAGGVLQGVIAISADDVWAVGVSRVTGQEQALTIHWDGREWSAVPNPARGVLHGVAAASKNDVWAVGTSQAVGSGVPGAFVLHWNGAAWSVVPGVDAAIDEVANGLTGGNTATAPVFAPSMPTSTAVSRPFQVVSSLLGLAVSVSSPSEVWAVGMYVDRTGEKTLILHWDGSNWSVSAFREAGQLTAVVAISPRDVWAVGMAQAEHKTLTVHWDGVAWTRVSSPSPGAQRPDFFNGNVLTGVSAASSDDVWAVGYYANMGADGAQPLALHWDGKSWTQTAMQPQPATPSLRSGAQLLAVSVVPASTPLEDAVWAVGSRVQNNYVGAGIVMRHTQAPCVVPTIPGSRSHFFPETNHTVSGVFLDYWDAHGALAQNGYPVSDLLFEMSELDGKTYTVQYFERAVFEFHPEQKPPYDVLLSQLGTYQYRFKYSHNTPIQEVNNTAGSVLFPETGKRLGGRFLDYWKSHGGLAQQGYPLSDEFLELNDLDGRPYVVQYFERAVFEFHPENKPPYDVLLSQLGKYQYARKYAKP